MVSYNTLEDISIEELHKTFLEVFSDYQVKIEMPLSKFQEMLQQRGCIQKASIGAFQNQKLVGFVLNGIRDWNGKITSYDVGTGVIATYRKQGITSNMFEHSKQLLQKMKVEQYLLEVLQTNTSAVQLYKKQGFHILRDFECFCLDKNKYNMKAIYPVENSNTMNQNVWIKLKECWDFEPSWQNSIESINAASDKFIYSLVYLNDTIVGYGVIDKKAGDILHIAVNKNHRRKGIGSSILTDLIKNSESNRISVLNVESQSKSIVNFLFKVGFENYVNQYEMVLKL
ncbi:GNAT family N-acetyltransferase [Anaeromicropila herbilytica]|uniref:Acetyltransferase n=1 Tax=Anaeromicropila herbilytica TaxID=2785025 RepID=A0A7R7ELV9_9FIRM|nr:GNAT family N-acetyltransferase [Anaeromicropila herbilytica]BCN31153.1 acetyltransferase [Anaeromicropila herbilytica]